MERFAGHIRKGEAGDFLVQPAIDHCRNVGRYASALLEPLGLGAAGELAGLVHDAGKFCDAFSCYIWKAAKEEPVRKGSVNHTFAGVRLLFERYYTKGQGSYRNLACEILAFGAGAHHGLFDAIDPDGKDGFLHRLETEGIGYEQARDAFVFAVGEAALDKLFDNAAAEIEHVLISCGKAAQKPDRQMFYSGVLSRLLLSAVIEGDRRDTAEFMQNFLVKEPPADMRPVWAASLEKVEEKLSRFPAQRPIDQARKEISRLCKEFPTESGGIYRLSVPTGSGKTLASLRLALSAAVRHGKRRIFFVIPLLSVLEQNAKVIRDYLQDDEMILEHHSNVVRTERERARLQNGGQSAAAENDLDMVELLTDNWHAPVVITTLVQLLNTFFDGGTTSIRRLQALADSVIVIDEVQSLPPRMISQFNLTLNFLSLVCNCTLVLSSATQPYLEGVEHPLRHSAVADIVPYSAALWEPFRRTEIIDRRKTGGYTPEQLADFVHELLPQRQSVLVICNKKAQAEQLYRLLENAPATVFHLSTAMCMQHRLDTVDKVKAALGKEPVICVATQLVEAGVDFSFGSVLRLCAGMDSVVQAAGRCNRNGEQEGRSPVYIVNWKEEDLSKLPEIRQGKKATEELLSLVEEGEVEWSEDLQSEEAIRYYYKRYYAQSAGGFRDYAVEVKKGISSGTRTTMLELLSKNTQFKKHKLKVPERQLLQAFKTAGDFFQVFEDITIDILVPYGEGADIIAALQSEQAEHDFNYRKELIDQAKKYSVSVLRYVLEKLEKAKGVYSFCEKSVIALQPGFYHEKTGVGFEEGNLPLLEVSDAQKHS